MADGTFKEYAVEDYAWRLYRHGGGNVEKLPDYFVTALEISAKAPRTWWRRSRPTSTPRSRRPSTCPRTTLHRFEGLYLSAWKAGLKGLATYRPNSVLGSVLSVTPSAEQSNRTTSRSSTPTKRLSIKSLPAPVLSSLRWPGRPDTPDGNPWPWTYMLSTRRAVRALRRPDGKPRRWPAPSPSRCG